MSEQVTRWQDLVVYDCDNNPCGTLGDLVESAPANLDDATIEGGRITVWPQVFLAAPGEGHDWDTPRGPVDWTGFVDRLRIPRGQV